MTLMRTIEPSVIEENGQNDGASEASVQRPEDSEKSSNHSWEDKDELLS